MKAKMLIAGLAVIASLMAQPPRGPRGFGPDGPGRGPGGPGWFGGPQNQVVTGAPYSGVEVRSSSQALANGTVIQHQDSTKVSRDGQGRVRRESTRTAPDGTTQTRITISDPVAGMAYDLDPSTKTAFSRPAHFPNQQQTSQNQTGSARGGRQGAQSSANTKQESLAAQSINGVMASGTRITHTIPAGTIGNSAVIETVHETWMADDLKVPVRSRMTDPRMGSTTMELTNLLRGEPDAALFTVPSDYTVKKMGGPGGRGPRGNGPPPAKQ
jgi:hypothetical protein